MLPCMGPWRLTWTLRASCRPSWMLRKHAVAQATGQLVNHMVGIHLKLEERGSLARSQTACAGCAAVLLCSSMRWCRLLHRHQAGKGAAYIKISESEIANDYPEPAQYEKVQMLQPVFSHFLRSLARGKCYSAMSLSRV